MKNIESEIKKVLEERRRDAISFAEKNLTFARENKEFVDIEKKIAEKTNEYFNLYVDNKPCDLVKKELDILEFEKEKILKNIGLSEADLMPKYICKKCSDSGKIDNKHCDCYAQIRNKILLKRSGIVSLERFEDADFKKNGTQGEKVFNLLQEWANKYPDVKKQSIYLSGQIGVGKTYLLKCAASKLIKRGKYVFYSTAFKMNNDFLEYCKAESSEKNYYLEPYLESEVLLIDDLGTEPILNNITLDYLYLVLNERLISGKATIINSNLDIDKLIDRYGERVFSRIVNKRNGLTIKFEGEDLRLKK